MEKTKKPAIRFDGFTEDWELYKVADCLVERNEQSPQSNEYPLMAFIANEGIVPKGERYDRSSLISDAENKLYKRTEFGDFIYSSNNLTSGSIGLNKYGKASISPVYSIFYPSELAESDFIGRRFVRDDFISEMIKWRQGVVYGQWRIHESDFVRIDVHIPQKAEQIIIGKFLDDVDGLIFQHQQKYDELLTFKKSMLEKLFPQNGAKEPEMRFAGFAGEWEFKKFGEVFEEYSEKNHNELPPLTIIQGVGTVRRDESGRSIQYDESGLKSYKLVREGDFIVHLRSFEGGLEKANSTGIVSPAYHMFHGDGTDTRFYYAYFRSKQFVDIQLKPHVYGIRDGRSIDIEGMKTIYIPYPSLLEQQKIGDFLEKIDDLTSNSQLELEKLKNIKSALLEKMFV